MSPGLSSITSCKPCSITASRQAWSSRRAVRRLAVGLEGQAIASALAAWSGCPCNVLTPARSSTCSSDSRADVLAVVVAPARKGEHAGHGDFRVGPARGDVAEVDDIQLRQLWRGLPFVAVESVLGARFRLATSRWVWSMAHAPVAWHRQLLPWALQFLASSR